VRSPTVRGAQTVDLRAELNCRHAGDDARITFEKAREHHLNIEGRNLDVNLEAVSPQSPGNAQSPKSPGNAQTQAGTSVAGVGCAALADHLRAVAWPSKFRPHLPEKYDGTTNPSEFLQVYVTAITVADGNDTVLASYFHVALTGPAKTWLMNLTPGTIQS